MTPKPFDPTKPVQTKDGRKARIICADAKNANRPIIALIMHGDDVERVWHYYSNGKFRLDNGDWPSDLVNVPSKRWVNLYLNSYNQNISAGVLHFSEKEATQNINKLQTFLKTVEIDWPE